MLISKNWITRLLANAGNEGFNPTDEELDAGFVRVGFETEGYAPLPETTGPLVIGRVKEIEELTGFKKPIRYCQVDVGQANGTGEPQGIICGARNFKEGDLVVVSLPGAVLPGGFAIAARETYDHISNGMMASAAELGLADRTTWVQCDYASALTGAFDLIASNPPYIPSADIAGLDIEVRAHDPRAALDGGADGLDAYRSLISQSAGLLASGGFLVVETGQGQSDDIEALMTASGLSPTGPPRADLGGIPRAVSARRPPR